VTRSGPGNPALARFARITAGATFLLLMAGASVTSTGSALAVPDWPLSNGKLFPRMTGGVLFEHGHRMIAGVVALLILTLCVWARRSEPRAWARRLAYAAGLLVLVQALLGGLTVLLLLPPAVSVAHAATAMLVFSCVVSFAVVTSRAWLESFAGTSAQAARVAPWAVFATGLTFAQILVGAVMRHLGAGLAFPDFPLAGGQVFPALTSVYQAIHFFHRVGGVLVTLTVWTLAGVAFGARREAPIVWRLAHFAAILVVFQFALGAASVLSGLNPFVTVAHHAGGAALLAMLLSLTLWSFRLARPAIVTAPPLAREPAMDTT
jgi:cytochrome c oxidase assembly protein subunit 15